MVKVQKLPYLALKCLISNLNPMEKIDFSLCSKKCKKAVKICTPKDIVAVTVNFKANSYVSMTTFDTEEDVRINTKQLCEKLGLVESLDTTVSVLQCTDFICEVLNCEVHGIVFGKSPLAKLSILNKWLKSRQKTLEYCEISQSVSKLQLIYILDNFEAEFLNVNDNDDFDEYDKPIKSKVLHMRVDGFVRHIQIEKSSLTKVELRSTLLSHSDINRILKAWVEGSIPNLELFVVTGIPSHDIMFILNGIERTELDENVKNRYEGVFNEDKVIAGGWDIRRSDGKMATIKMSTNRNNPGRFMFRLVSHSLFLN